MRIVTIPEEAMKMPLKSSHEKIFTRLTVAKDEAAIITFITRFSLFELPRHSAFLPHNEHWRSQSQIQSSLMTSRIAKVPENYYRYFQFNKVNTKS